MKMRYEFGFINMTEEMFDKWSNMAIEILENPDTPEDLFMAISIINDYVSTENY